MSSPRLPHAMAGSRLHAFFIFIFTIVLFTFSAYALPNPVAAPFPNRITPRQAVPSGTETGEPNGTAIRQVPALAVSIILTIFIILILTCCCCKKRINSRYYNISPRPISQGNQPRLIGIYRPATENGIAMENRPTEAPPAYAQRVRDEVVYDGGAVARPEPALFPGGVPAEPPPQYKEEDDYGDLRRPAATQLRSPGGNNNGPGNTGGTGN